MRQLWAVALLAALACGELGPSENPEPTITRLIPEFLTAGGSQRSVLIEGSGFSIRSLIAIDSVIRDSIVHVSQRQLRLILPDSEFFASGRHELRVFNPQPGGGLSAPVTLEIRAPIPVVTSVNDGQVIAGQSVDTVVISGTNFLRNSVVRFNGSARPTTWLDATTLRVILSETDLDSARSFDITVTNPPPEGGTSNAIPLTLVNGVPAITLLPSQGAHAGGAGFSLMVHGSGFVEGSTVQWNGADRPTQYVSRTRVVAEIAPADVASPGIANVTVVNAAPGGGTSQPAMMTVRSVPLPDPTSSVRIEGLDTRDLAPDDARGVIYLSVGAGPNLLHWVNSVLALDPLTVVVTRYVFVGSDPSRIALSSDGSFLFVGLNGAGAVRRVNLVGFSAGPQWSLNPGEIAGEIRALPGQPLSVVVSRQLPGISPPLTAVSIYDNGVARPQSGPGHTGGNRIEVLDKPDTLYGFNNSHTGFEFFTISIDASGAHYADTTRGLIQGFYTQITGAAGRIYGTDGSIVDAERRVRVGSFPTTSLSTAVDPVLGRAFLLQSDRIEVYDLNNYQLLGTVPIYSFSPGHPATAYPHLVRWGTDGVAFRDPDALFLFRSPLFGP